jgi:feruloyl esterase
LHTSLTALTTNTATGSPATIAGVEGAVSATTDKGHSVNNGSLAMDPDNTVNHVGWNDFSARGVHEMYPSGQVILKSPPWP